MLPAPIAPDATTPAPTPTKAAREPRITKLVRQACDLLSSGECKTIKAAAGRLSCSPEHLYRMLKRDHVQAFLAREARQTIALGLGRASTRIVELLDAQSEHVALDASKHIAAIAGIKPAESGTNVSITNNITAGYIINLGERTAPAATPPVMIDVQKAGEDAPSR